MSPHSRNCTVAFTRTHVHTHAHEYAHNTHIHTQGTHTWGYTHIHTHTSIHTQVHTHERTHRANIHIHRAHTHTRTEHTQCTHTQVHTHKYTHTNTQKHSPEFKKQKFRVSATGITHCVCECPGGVPIMLGTPSLSSPRLITLNNETPTSSVSITDETPNPPAPQPHYNTEAVCTEGEEG